MTITVHSSVAVAQKLVLGQTSFLDVEKTFIITIWRNHYCKAALFSRKDLEHLRDQLTELLQGGEHVARSEGSPDQGQSEV